jgi:hypothetical protein
MTNFVNKFRFISNLPTRICISQFDTDYWGIKKAKKKK